MISGAIVLEWKTEQTRGKLSVYIERFLVKRRKNAAAGLQGVSKK
jgi:hypothetical protein